MLRTLYQTAHLKRPGQVGSLLGFFKLRMVLLQQQVNLVVLKLMGAIPLL